MNPMLLFALLLTAIAACRGDRQDQPVRTTLQTTTTTLPDVVIFVLDDVSDVDVDLAPTPNIHALAEQGVRFRRAYAHAWCAPTRDSLLYSQWLGIDRGDACGSATEVTRNPSDYNMARLFEASGYNTCHFGKWHLGTQLTGPWELTPQACGFDRSLCSYHVGDSCDLPGPGHTRVDDGVVSKDLTNDIVAMRDAFIEWWNETPTPRFAVVNWLAGHSPYTYPPASLLPGYQYAPTNRNKFEAEIAGADYAMGQLMPLFGDDDWIVFAADNGTAADVAQDPNRAKLTCYEGGIRVPLIVRGPGASVGLETHVLADVIDLLPTFAAVLGASTPTVHGRSLLPAFAGGPGDCFVFAYSPPRVDNAMMDTQWKLLTRPDGLEELYDMLNDPLEQSPLPATGSKANTLRFLRGRVLAGHSVPYLVGGCQ